MSAGQKSIPPVEATLQQALTEYLDSLKPEARQSQRRYVEAFVSYLGESFRIAELQGSRVEQYVESQIKPSDPNAPDRVAALKSWFLFLRKRNYTPDRNYGIHVRVRRQSTRPGANAVRVEEAPVEMTAAGIEALKQELAELDTRRDEIVRAIAHAREDGDLRENAPYHAAREQLAFTNARRDQLENTLRRAVVAERKETDLTAVGSRVTVVRLDTQTPMDYTLVDAREANAAERKISIDSPVGRALLGHRVGDVVVVAAPRGEIEYRIDAVVPH